MDKFLQQAREYIQSLTSRQQIIFGGIGLALLIAIAVFSSGVGHPEFKVLYSGLAQEEAQTVARRLAEKGVAYELTTDGTGLKVAPDQLDKVRLELAAQGLPRSGRLGFEIFDKPNWAGSDFAEKVNYQRALEGELERTIQTIQAVEEVRVHLVMPRESLFTEREREAKASVVLKLRSARVEEESVKAITFLVASAVDTLKPENVTIVGADGRPLTAAGAGGTGLISAQGLEASLQKKLIATLVPVIGAESLRASVNVEFDSSTTETSQENYDPAKSVVLTTQQSEDRQGAGGAGVGGIPGTASNVPSAIPLGAIPITKATSDDGQVQKTQAETYAVSRMVRHNMQPAGALKHVATAVLIDDAPGHKKRSAEELKALEELAKAAVGFDATRGDTLTLENISFQSIPQETMAKPQDWKDKLDTQVERWKNPLRYFGMFLAVLALYLFVIRPMQAPRGATVASQPAQLAASAAAGAGAGGAAGAGETVKLAGASGAAKQILPMNPLDDETFLSSELAEELASTSSDVKRAVILKRHLVEKVKTDPAVAGRLIQNWIRSKGERR